MKIAISVNTTWNIVNFRSNLIRSFILDGHDVIAISPPDDFVSDLKKLGCSYIPLQMDNKGANPIKDLVLFFRYIMIFCAQRPHIYIGYTIKPNIYGSIAAKLLKIPVINNITGLGTTFIKETLITRIVEKLYKVSLSNSKCVFFQNREDKAIFLNRGLINLGDDTKNSSRFQILPGSGIDLNRFYPRNNRNMANDKDQAFVFLFMGRVLKDKGIEEFVGAARLIKSFYKNVRFCILGSIDAKNSTAISQDLLDSWVAEGIVEYLGAVVDVRNNIAISDCIVLPSYREGTPRSLLEAAAMARPIIATDVAGCRDVVDDQKNGFLCKPYDSKDLSLKMKKMLELDASKRKQMGLEGRIKVESEFNEKLVISKYRNVILMDLQ